MALQAASTSKEPTDEWQPAPAPETPGTDSEWVELARQLHPDVIILDIVLSDGDGIQPCRDWQGDDDLKRIAVLLVSGVRAGQVDRDKALEAGALAYVQKPVDLDQLIAEIACVA